MAIAKLSELAPDVVRFYYIAQLFSDKWEFRNHL